jgi:hypothetical protein
VHVDFSGSNIDNGFDSVEERSSKDGGWIILVFSHVNDLKIRIRPIITKFSPPANMPLKNIELKIKTIGIELTKKRQ